MHILTPYFLTVFLLFSSGTIVALNESEKKLTRAQFIVELEALHPGVTAEQVRDNTGFDIHIDDDLMVTESPTIKELEVLRHLDPEQLYTA